MFSAFNQSFNQWFIIPKDWQKLSKGVAATWTQILENENPKILQKMAIAEVFLVPLQLLSLERNGTNKLLRNRTHPWRSSWEFYETFLSDFCLDTASGIFWKDLVIWSRLPSSAYWKLSKKKNNPRKLCALIFKWLL